MIEKKPNALRIADILQKHYEFLDTDDAAQELRRLHEVNADLLNAAKLFIKYDSNQDDGVGMINAYNDAIEATKAAVTKATGE